MSHPPWLGMEVQHARCAGIDLHKKSTTVCVLIWGGATREDVSARVRNDDFRTTRWVTRSTPQLISTEILYEYDFSWPIIHLTEGKCTLVSRNCDATGRSFGDGACESNSPTLEIQEA
jgi:hypothetical protein